MWRRARHGWIQVWFERVIKYDRLFARGSLAGLLIWAGLSAAVVAEGMPTGLGALHYGIVISIGVLGWGLGTLAGAILLTLTFIPLPRLLVSGALVYGGLLVYTLSFYGVSYLAGTVLAAGLIISAVLIGSSIAYWRRMLTEMASQRSYAPSSYDAHRSIFSIRPALVICYSIGCFMLTLSGAIWLLGPGSAAHPPAAIATIQDSLPARLDPSQPGLYTIAHYTYGSGKDRHRPEFAEGADWITEPVDASDFLTGWLEPRTWFWGFDESELPLNGRVWMPEEAGKYPLVLIVHGSDYMEYFSDEGYEYLGKLLASQGFIAVSIDENFINYSTWSGGLDWDMTIRAWVLLKHLQVIEQASGQPGNMFSNKVDMENIALVGHSRGGQAAVLAAEFNDFFRNSDQIAAPLELYYNIETVIAFSPTDKLVDGRRLTLRNAHYLVIHGAMDGDVNTFAGDGQFRRTSFNRNSDRFKASIYIQGANHGQFNTAWGSYDISAPAHLLMNRADMLAPEEQQRIAEVYVSAFLQATLKERAEYVPMFRDYRYALEWLPETAYINRFEDDSFNRWSSFQQLQDKSKGYDGVRFSGEQLQEWDILEVKDRLDRSTGNKAAYIAWDGAEEAAFSIELPTDEGESIPLSSSSVVAFSIANGQLEPTDDEPAPAEPEIMIELQTDDEQVIRMPLEDVAPVPPVIYTQYTKAPWLEEELYNGGLGAPAEVVFQTVEVPLALIEELQPQFDPNRLLRIRLIFPEGTSGALYIDDIGLYL